MRGWFFDTYIVDRFVRFFMVVFYHTKHAGFGVVGVSTASFLFVHLVLFVLFSGGALRVAYSCCKGWGGSKLSMSVHSFLYRCSVCACCAVLSMLQACVL